MTEMSLIRTELCRNRFCFPERLSIREGLAATPNLADAGRFAGFAANLGRIGIHEEVIHIKFADAFPGDSLDIPIRSGGGLHKSVNYPSDVLLSASASEPTPNVRQLPGLWPCRGPDRHGTRFASTISIGCFRLGRTWSVPVSEIRRLGRRGRTGSSRSYWRGRCRRSTRMWIEGCEAFPGRYISGFRCGLDSAGPLCENGPL